MADQHLAIAQHRDGAARSRIGAWQRFDGAVQSFACHAPHLTLLVNPPGKPFPCTTQEAQTAPMEPSYLDPRTGETFPLDRPRWCGTDRAPLLLTSLPGIT